MSDAPRPMSWNMLQSSLRESFVEGVSWPIDRAFLAALVDMGMTNDQIATYFAVAPDDVHMLRDQHRLLSPPRN